MLSNRAAPRSCLRELLAGDEPILAPGACDVLSARLVEQAGFDMVYMTGFGLSASYLGRPDVGLLSQSEMVDNARRMASTVDLPLLADADNGYGNPVNVIRTVRDYERAGVAALHLEDQTLPKRCGHLAGKQVIPADDMVAKVRAAVDARTDPDLVIVARTDAAAVEGIDAAIERARRYADAGADALFVESPTTEAEVEKVATALDGHHLLFNWLEGGRSPQLSRERLRELGFAMVIYPVTALLAATAGVRSALADLRAKGSPALTLDALDRRGGVTGINPFTEIVGIEEIQALESAYGD